jgi:hypothetical protein
MSWRLRFLDRAGQALFTTGLLTLLCFGPPLSGQVVAPPGPDSVTVVPGAVYQAGAFYRSLAGDGYRDLWTTAIRVPVADVGELAGGLTPVREGGGMTTQTLHLTGADGRRYVFRSVDKTPADLLEDFVGTPLEAILQDQISSFHPTGAPVVARLLEALDILHPSPRYVVVPDDPRLGEFRERFANMLVLFEERPDDGPDGAPGFAGSRRIVQTDELLEDLEEDPGARVDAEELLRGRLLDILVGDRDRSHNNHLWAEFEDGGGRTVWRVIPRDRDQAFVQFDGILKGIARTYDPRLVTFSSVYPDIAALTRNAWDIDRNLLVGLDRSAWLEAVADVKARLTDGVLEQAAAQMPRAHREAFADELTARLMSRRDHLDQAAEHLYDIVFGYADIHSTDEAERADVDYAGDGSVTVTVQAPGYGTTFSRTFHPAETKEVRLYLHGGDDEVFLRGTYRSAIEVRVVGGGGDDVFTDQAPDADGRTMLYDGGDDTDFPDGHGTRSIRRNAPRPYSWFEEMRTLDWGGWLLPEPRLGYDVDRGLVLLAGFTYDRYGFLKEPYETRTRVRAGWAFGRSEPIVDIRMLRRTALGSSDLMLSARWSGVEVLEYYGQGNDIGPAGSTRYHRVTHKQVTLAPAISRGDGDRVTFQVGPIFKHSTTDTTSSGYIADTDPYGSGSFTQAGLQALFDIDRRDRAGTPGDGYVLRGGLSWYPDILDVDRGAFGEIHGEAATYLSPSGANPVLAVRAGGKKVWGRHPFAESAFLGGASTVRGLREQRYAGHASLYGSAELRVFLARLFLLTPTDVGGFGLTDAGRVYAEGETSSTWHTSVGGGIWFAPLKRSSTMQLSLARSEGRNALYLGVGFAF